MHTLQVYDLFYMCMYIAGFLFINVWAFFPAPMTCRVTFSTSIKERGDAGTPPGRNNPTYAAPLNIVLPDQLSKRCDHEVVMQRSPKQELVGGDECWTVYRMEALLPHSVVYMESGFLSRDVLTSYGVADMTALYCSKV